MLLFNNTVMTRLALEVQDLGRLFAAQDMACDHGQVWRKATGMLHVLFTPQTHPDDEAGTALADNLARQAVRGALGCGLLLHVTSVFSADNEKLVTLAMKTLPMISASLSSPEVRIATSKVSICGHVYVRARSVPVHVGAFLWLVKFLRSCHAHRLEVICYIQ